MRLLYVAPRFHPNQYPILEGLINMGHQVYFLASKIGETEKRGEVNVRVLSPSKLTKAQVRKWSENGPVYAEDKLVFWFIPDRKELKKYLTDIHPDVVIVRERNLLSLATVILCKTMGIKKILLYNQSPIYTKKDKIPMKIKRKIWFSLFPKKRITVCRYSPYPEIDEKYICDKNAYFMPHVPRTVNLKNREYLRNGKVNIFDCGKYRDYKNHLLLIEAVKILVNQGFTNFNVIILGQAINADERSYYDKCRNLVEKYKLESFISLENCVPYDDIPDYYLKSDLFILPSKSEQATVSILDSMSYGLATISTSHNGTADYIKPGVTGEVFQTNNAEDLAQKILIYLRNPGIISAQGRNAFDDVRNNFSFEVYYKKFLDIIEGL